MTDDWWYDDPVDDVDLTAPPSGTPDSLLDGTDGPVAADDGLPGAPDVPDYGTVVADAEAIRSAATQFTALADVAEDARARMMALAVAHPPVVAGGFPAATRLSGGVGDLAESWQVAADNLKQALLHVGTGLNVVAQEYVDSGDDATVTAAKLQEAMADATHYFQETAPGSGDEAGAGGNGGAADDTGSEA